MISTTTEYAIRAMVSLASQPPGVPATATQISIDSGVPRNYLSKILGALRRGGLVTGERGPHGGFKLSRPARAITTLEIVGQFEQVDSRRRCILGEPLCVTPEECEAHRRWSDVWSALDAFLRETTLETFCTAPCARSRFRWRAEK